MATRDPAVGPRAPRPDTTEDRGGLPVGLHETIPARFARQVQTFTEKPLFLVKRGGRFEPLTWRQAAEQVTTLAQWLLQQRVSQGDRVLVLSENRPEWGIADLAIQSAGAWTVPIYPTLTAGDLRVIAKDCQPVAGIASTPEQLAKLVEVKQHVPALRSLIVIEGQPTGDGVTSWTEAVARGREAANRLEDLLAFRLKELRPEDPSTIIYTSGTTGEPKGVLLSHRNFLSNVEACREAIPVSSSDVHLSFLPLSHVFERMAGWYLMLSVGATVAFAESLDTVPDDMLAVRPTIMMGVPRFFEKLYARIQERLLAAPPSKRRLIDWALTVGREVARRRTTHQHLPFGLAVQSGVARALVFRKLQSRLGGRLRFFVSGSAPLSKEIAEFFFSVGVTILEGYGLTETSPVIAANRLPVPVFGSVGPPVPGVEVKIAEDGEILTRGPHVMLGYYQKPEATQATIVDGWLHTGDIGHVDAQGCVFITDRKKDLIKTAGGKFVAPQKLENLFVTDPYISQAYLYGDKRRYCVALIVPAFDALRRLAQEQEIGAESLSELVEHPKVLEFYWGRVQALQRELPSFEQVKRIGLLDQEFSQASGELTPTLKAKRSVIATRYEAVLERLYEVPTS